MGNKTIFISLIFVIVSLVFFHPVFNGKVPFPGDLLVGEYAPYNSYHFLGYSPGGYPNKGQSFDVLRLLYPEKEFSIRIFKNLEFPFWNPYNFSGNPHIASLQSGSFYPLNIIFILPTFVYGWIIFILLQPILTGIFTFLAARELRLNIKSAVFSGLVFAFSSYNVVWMEYGNIGHSILWMPFAMWLTLKNLQKPSFLKSVLISLSLTFSIIAGYIQTSFYVFLFLGGFVIFHIFFVDKKDKAQKLSLFFLIFILPILLSAIQLIPMLELISQSARSPYSRSEFLKLLVPPFHIVTMFAPDFFGNPATRNYWLSGTYIERVTYIGVASLIFIIYSFLKKQKKYFWFFAISAIGTLLLSFDTYFARIVYFFDIPLVSTAVPTRIIFLYCFSASMLAGFGLNAFLKDTNKKLLLKTAFILGGIYILVWLFVFTAPVVGEQLSWIVNLSVSKRNLILPTLIFFVSMLVLLSGFYVKKYKSFLFIFLLILTTFDLFYFFHKITPFAPKDTVYPRTEVLEKLKSIQGINRSWGYGSGYISTNIQTFEKIFSPDGYNALYIKRYGEILSSSKNGKIAISIPRSDPMIAPGYGESNLRENKYRQRLLDLLGVKYVLSKNTLLGINNEPDRKTFPKETYKLIWQQTPWQIYENLNSLPRVFLASDYVVESNKAKIIQMIFDEEFDLRNKIILEEELFPKIALSQDKNAKVEIKKYTSNKIILKTNATSNMLLFLSDNYYPGWKVSIDGKDGKIYRANYSFRAVPVTKGKHEVVFSYYPESFDLGIKISSVTFVLLLGSFISNKFIKGHV